MSSFAGSMVVPIEFLTDHLCMFTEGLHPACGPGWGLLKRTSERQGCHGFFSLCSGDGFHCRGFALFQFSEFHAGDYKKDPPDGNDRFAFLRISVDAGRIGYYNCGAYLGAMVTITVGKPLPHIVFWRQDVTVIGDRKSERPNERFFSERARGVLE